jgi:hypothetical protein
MRRLSSCCWWRWAGPRTWCARRCRRRHAAVLSFTRCRLRGRPRPLELAGAWQLRSPNSDFGSYSALSRSATARCWRPATAGAAAVLAARRRSPRPIGRSSRRGKRDEARLDIEALTRDPASGRIWAAFEAATGSSATSRVFAARRRPARGDARLAEQQGPEAMVRLADGRFVVLAEGRRAGSTRMPGLLFAADPLAGAVPVGSASSRPRAYRPVDMAQLPDGRVLILLRESCGGCRRAFAAS